MKNILKGLTVSGMALLALAGGSGVVFAAEATTLPADATGGSANGKSTAEFEVTPGDLTLDAVPDLNFGTTNVKDIATKDVILSLVDGKVTSEKDGNVTSKDVTAKDGNADLNLKVSDFRGVNSGWNLTAKLGTFKANIKDSKSNDASDALDRLNGVILHLVVNSNDDATKTNPVKPAVVDLKQGSADGVTLLNADGDKSDGGGENNFIADTSSTLTIPKDPKIKAATYQADVTWTLGNTFATAPANSNE